MVSRTAPLPALALALFLCSVPVHAQRYHVHHYSEADGLPSSTVRGVTQGPDGRMWFATRVGAASYDGRTWRTYGLDDGLADTNLMQIVTDDDGNVWTAMALLPLRIGRFDGVGWTTLEPPCDHDGASLVTQFAVATHGGVTWFAAALSDGTLHVGPSDDRALGEPWRRIVLDVAADAEPPEVLALESADDAFLVGTSQGLFRVSMTSGTFTGRRLAGTGERILGVDHAPDTGRTWVVGDDWVGMLETGGFRRVVVDHAFNTVPEFISMIAQDDGLGGLYFGNPSGLWYYHPQTGLESVGRLNGLIAHGATGVHVDREDNLWITGLRGLSKIVSRRFAGYDHEHGLLVDEVSAVLVRSNGEIVLGQPGGLTYFGPDRRTLVLGDEHRTRVMDLVEDADGTLWIVANHGGLFRVRDGAVIEHFDMFEDGAPMTSILLDAAGTPWIATTKGVWRRSADGTFEPTQPLGTAVRRLAIGSDGQLYAAANNEGVLRWDGERFERWARSDDGSVNNTYAVHQDLTGEMLVGTAAGLYRAVNGRLVKARAPGPQVDNPVYFIVEDAQGRKWFGTDHGVVRWDGRQQTHFGVADGLIGSETNRAGGRLDRQGRLWIGTNRGVSVYRSLYDAPRGALPEVHLVELDAGGERLPPSEGQRLKADRNTLLFRFHATSFVDEKRVRFRYRLAGFDDDWIGPQQLPMWELRYARVPPGEYRLHLQAVDAEGRRSAEVTSATIVILRPVWMRLWFLALVATATIGLFVAVASYVSQRRYARRLEHEVRERTREVAKAQRLEALGLLAGGIAHDFNNLLTVVLGNLALSRGKDQRTAEARHARARAATEQAQRLTRQLLTFSAGGAPILRAASVEQVIHESTAFALSGADTSFEVDLPEDLWVVEIDEDQMSQVLGNLLLNARQASPPGAAIRVSGQNVEGAPVLLPDGRYVVVAIEDEGSGIPREHLDRVFDPYFTTKEGGTGLGLATAYSIVSRHDGRLTVESEAGKGSVFRIYLPASEKAVQGARRRPDTAVERRGFGRILVMDDDPAVRAITAEMLGEYGYIVDEAADGRAAVDCYRDAARRGQPYDVVIMDLTVPGGMGGKEAVKRLLEIDPAATAIVVSGYSNDPVMASHREYGFAACLAKPFTPEELARTLQRVRDTDERRAEG